MHRFETYISICQGLSDEGAQVLTSVQELLGLVTRHGDNLEAMSRDLCVSIAHIYIAALLLGKTEGKFDDVVFFLASTFSILSSELFSWNNLV